MINSISQNSANKNIFTPIQSSGVSYAITKPFTETQKIEVKEEQEKKGNRLGYKIAKVALIAGFGLFALMKGTPAPVRRKVTEWVGSLESKISKMGKSKNLSKLQVVYLKTLRKARTLAGYSKALFNTAPLKDVLVIKALKKVPVLDRFGQRITDLFEKISFKTSNNSYSKTLVHFDSMYDTIAEASKKLSPEVAAKVQAEVDLIKLNMDTGFSKRPRKERFINTKESLNGIFNAVWNETYSHLGKFLASKKSYTTFCSEELTMKQKIKLSEEVRAISSQITNDVNDYYNASNKIIKQIDTFIDYTDPNSREKIQKIKNTLNAYKKSVEAGQKNKNIIKSEQFPESLQDLNKYIKESKKYSPETTQAISKAIENLHEVLVNDKKGAIQNILYYFKASMPNSEYRKLKKEIYKAVNSLNKSIDLETDKLFDKERDLKIGSAPTDVLGVLSSIGIVAYGLTRAENKDERISVAVKYGVPTIGAVLIALYCTVGLISAGPSLVIGFASGLAMNKLGVILDKKRKEYQEKPLPLTSPDKLLPALKEKAKSI